MSCPICINKHNVEKPKIYAHYIFFGEIFTIFTENVFHICLDFELKANVN